MSGVVKRFYDLVDRRTGTALGATFRETEADVRGADAALDEMSPGEGQGGRKASRSTRSPARRVLRVDE